MVNQQGGGGSVVIFIEADDGGVIGDVDVHHDPSTLQRLSGQRLEML